MTISTHELLVSILDRIWRCSGNKVRFYYHFMLLSALSFIDSKLFWHSFLICYILINLMPLGTILVVAVRCSHNCARHALPRFDIELFFFRDVRSVTCLGMAVPVPQPPIIARCELLHTLSFQCQVLGKKAVCTTFKVNQGINRPWIRTHDRLHGYGLRDEKFQNVSEVFSNQAYISHAHT